MFAQDKQERILATENIFLKSPFDVKSIQATPNLRSITQVLHTRIGTMGELQNSPLLYFQKLQKLSQLGLQLKSVTENQNDFLNNITMDQHFVQKYFDFDSESEHFEIDQETAKVQSKDLDKIIFLKETSQLEQQIQSNYLLFSDILKVDNQSSILEAMKLKRSYQCDLCDQSFNSGCALGGHWSKVHSLNGKKKYNKMKDLFNKNQEQEQRAQYLKELKKQK